MHRDCHITYTYHVHFVWDVCLVNAWLCMWQTLTVAYEWLMKGTDDCKSRSLGHIYQFLQLIRNINGIKKNLINSKHIKWLFYARLKTWYLHKWPSIEHYYEDHIDIIRATWMLVTTTEMIYRLSKYSILITKSPDQANHFSLCMGSSQDGSVPFVHDCP